MNQRYVDTIRCSKTLMGNLDRLHDTLTDGQQMELERVLRRLAERLLDYLEEPEDDGLWVGEE